MSEPRPAPWRTPPQRAGWWLAAAATLLLALGAGLGLSGSELRFENGHVAFRLGRSGDLEQALAAQEARHRQEIAQLRAELASRQDDAVMQRVRKLVHESEERNALLVGASLAELSDRYDAQRRYDLARVSASLSYLDGRTGQQLARTSELMNVMLRAADEQ